MKQQMRAPDVSPPAHDGIRREHRERDSLSDFGARFDRARLQRVNDRIFSAIGYAISNAIYVVTGESIVVIDTTESISSARASLEEFRKLYQLPVSHIIYTHFHGDHIRGARVFHESSTRVIAQRRLPEEVAYVTRMLPYRKRITALQFGFHLKPKQRGVAMVGEIENGYVAPDILFDEEYRFQEGKFTFELFHTQGETVDHLMVWIPELRALLPGDLYYAKFPMLSNPMRPDRPVLAWAESLERMRALKAEYLVPSHGNPVTGAAEIDLVLSNYARAIRHVHDETIKLINDGLPLERIRNRVRLPEDLASLTYLREGYGKVAWSVNGIFRQNTGWYGFNPAELNPSASTEFRAALIEAMGGPGPLVNRARKALHEGRHQLALELADVVIGVRPRNLGAKAVRLRALRGLAAASENGVEQNIYGTALKRARMALDPLASQPSDPARLHYSGIWTKPFDNESEQEQLSTGTTRGHSPVDRAGGDVALAKKTAHNVNELYNERMHRPAVQVRYGRSGFHNHGYWRRDTLTQTEACENLMEVLLRFLPSQTGTILDVACGMGGTTRFLTKSFLAENVTGINISRKQLASCRKIAPGCRFLEMNATALRFGPGSFDNVICVEAAFHFVTREKFLSEAHRVLKPGGRLVLTDVVPARPHKIPNRFAPMQRVISPSEYCDLYFRADFERVEIIDASRECSTGFRRHSLRLLRNNLLDGQVDRASFHAKRERIINRERNKGYYLLVCAQKREPK
jgi:glyoxylase-like metal-dependent hydrolase (beta-lactamase superfamily II)/SAM-dependent methyltransferase